MWNWFSWTFRRWHGSESSFCNYIVSFLWSVKDMAPCVLKFQAVLNSFYLHPVLVSCSLLQGAGHRHFWVTFKGSVWTRLLPFFRYPWRSLLFTCYWWGSNPSHFPLLLSNWSAVIPVYTCWLCGDSRVFRSLRYTLPWLCLAQIWMIITGHATVCFSSPTFQGLLDYLVSDSCVH